MSRIIHIVAALMLTGCQSSQRPVNSDQIAALSAKLASADGHKAGDAIRALQRHAAEGSPTAAYVLGRMYLQDSPKVVRNLQRARGYLMQAWQAGEHRAAFYLGAIATNSDQGEPDFALAATWFERGAQHGSAQSMFLLGNAYRDGIGVLRDAGRAVALYTQAAQLDHPAALQTLAMAYQHGDLGLTADPDQARYYLMGAEHALTHWHAELEPAAH